MAYAPELEDVILPQVEPVWRWRRWDEDPGAVVSQTGHPSCSFAHLAGRLQSRCPTSRACSARAGLGRLRQIVAHRADALLLESQQVEPQVLHREHAALEAVAHLVASRDCRSAHACSLPLEQCDLPIALLALGLRPGGRRMLHVDPAPVLLVADRRSMACSVRASSCAFVVQALDRLGHLGTQLRSASLKAFASARGSRCDRRAPASSGLEC